MTNWGGCTLKDLDTAEKGKRQERNLISFKYSKNNIMRTYYIKAEI